VWLFSSGPLGTVTQDAQGREILDASKPTEFAETITPRDLTVFYGALDPHEHDDAAWLLRRVPAGRALLPQGGFWNWDVIAAWAERIARELSATTNAT
jgi:menaquinone-dependent protoporphyrinogen oxidase